MHIVLDARKLNDGGIGTYIKNLIGGLALNPQHRVTIITGPDLVSSDFVPNFPETVEVVCDSAKPYSFSEYLLMPLRQRELISAADIYHSPHFTLPYFLTAPAVVTVHDTILLTHPRRKRDAIIARQLMASALKRADRVITVSQTSREKLLHHWPWIRDKLRVVYNVPSPDLIKAVADVTSESGDYFLFIGGERRHKGFDRLLEAWRILAGKYGANCPKLIAVGSEFDLSRQSILGTALEQAVIFKGNVPDRELGRLLRGAKFLLMPSLDEGFGLPILEALTVGTAVICSDIPVFWELFPKGTFFVSDQSGAGFAVAVETVLNDRDRRDLLSREGKVQIAEYSLSKHIAETLAIYQECLR